MVVVAATAVAAARGVGAAAVAMTVAAVVVVLGVGEASGGGNLAQGAAVVVARVPLASCLVIGFGSTPLLRAGFVSMLCGTKPVTPAS